MAKCLEQDDWQIRNVYMRARDRQGNLVVQPKQAGPAVIIDPMEEWLDALRHQGIPEWQIREVREQYAARQPMNGEPKSTA